MLTDLVTLREVAGARYHTKHGGESGKETQTKGSHGIIFLCSVSGKVGH